MCLFITAPGWNVRFCKNWCACEFANPVGSLDDMESNRAGFYRRAAAAAADLPPALSRDTRHATMSGEPGCGGSRRWLTAAV